MPASTASFPTRRSMQSRLGWGWYYSLWGIVILVNSKILSVLSKRRRRPDGLFFLINIRLLSSKRLNRTCIVAISRRGGNSAKALNHFFPECPNPTWIIVKLLHFLRPTLLFGDGHL